jgi:hypothetical protein
MGLEILSSLHSGHLVAISMETLTFQPTAS